MVAIVTGAGLGLQRDSASALGAQGQLGSATLGQAGEKVTVNAANGNLIIQSRDEMLIGLGLDDVVANTYNSQGTFTANGWQESFQRHVGGLTGTVNTAGSTITHYAADGSAIVYTYNTSTGLYVGNEMGGAYDTLAYSSSTSQWTWQDGKTRATELYDTSANGGRLLKSTDASGNVLSYTYTGSQLTKIATANGDYTSFVYTGSLLTSVVTSYTNASGLQTETRVRYGYDASNRLTMVTTDLTPNDSSISDGNTYVTTYGYDGTSDRINAITQSDGTSLSLTYTWANGGYAVANYTQTMASGVSQTTSFTYAPGRTTVTDPQGNATTLVYDGKNQLIQLISPGTAGGPLQVQAFSYDTNGTLLYSGPEGDPNFTNIGQTWNGLAQTDNSVSTTQSTETDGGIAVYRRQTNGTPASGWSMNLSQSTNVITAVVPGQTVWASAYAASSGSGSLTIIAEWFNASGTWFGGTQVSGITPGGNFAGGLATANYGSGAVIVPAGAAYVGLTVQSHADGSGPMNVAIARPVVEMAGPASDANFTYLTQDWYGLAQTDGSVSTNQSTENDGGVLVYRRQTNGTPASGWSMNLSQSANAFIAVVPGQTVWASAYAASSGAASLTLYAEWFDANGAWFGGSQVSGITTGGTLGASGLATANQGSGSVTVPAGAAYVGLTVQAHANGSAPMNVAIAKPTLLIGGAAPNASIPTYNYTYDTNGNRLSMTDALGNKTTYSYDGNNQLLTKTEGANSSSPQTTRYVYDGNSRLVYTISARGDVTRYVYNAQGEQTSVIQYTGALYTTSGTPSQSNMDAWSAAGGLDLTQIRRADTTYDARGQVATVTTYGQTDSNGNGVASTASTAYYVYDQAGNLLSRKLSSSSQTETFAYDGLGRVISATDFNGKATSTVYSNTASGLQVAVTLANGTTKTSTYDKAGDLISSTTAGGGLTATTTYAYDANGNLIKTTDPTGLTSYFVYDAMGRKVADVSADGAIVAYAYNADSQVISTTQYANKLSTTQLSLLASETSTSAPVGQAVAMPVASANDRWSWNVYDTAGHLAETIDPVGAVTGYSYDADNRLVAATDYANPLSAATLAAFKTSAPAVVVLPAANAASDRTTRTFYNTDDQVVGTLDADGYLTQIIYDDSGAKVQTITYANVTNSGHWANGTFAQLLADAGSSGSDIYHWWVYDGQGHLRADIDGLGNITRYDNYTVHGDAGTVTSGQVINVASLIGANPPTFATLSGLSATGTPAITSYTYDQYGHVLTKVLTLTGGTTETTTYGYDNLYDLASQATASSSSASGGADGRTLTIQHDALGRKSADVSGNGASTVYTYDTAGRVISQTDPLGRRTLFYYDVDGRLTYQVDAAGGVVQYGHNTFSEKSDITAYATAIAAGTLSGLTGGQITSALTSAITTSANDSHSHIDHNADGTVSDTIDALGAVTSFSYDAFGDVTGEVDPLSSGVTTTTNRTYSRRGLLLTSTANVGGLGLATSYSYDAFERVTQVIDPANNTTKTTYDRAGQVLTRVDGLNHTTTYTYDGFGHVLTAIDPTNAKTTYAYSLFDRQVTVTDPNNISTVTTKNAYGQTVKVTDGTGATTTYAYDADGNLTSKTDAAGNITRMAYDTADQLTSVTDAGGYVTGYTYDAAGRVVQTVRYPAGVTANALPATPPAGSSVTRYAYDGEGRKAFVIDPTGMVTALTYDADGHVTKTVQYATLATATGVQSLGAMQSWASSHATASDRTTQAAYDAGGRLTASADAAGYVTGYAYDAEGRITQQTRYPAGVTFGALPGTPPAGSQVTAMTYDGDGNLINITDPLGIVTHNVYDADGRRKLSIVAYGTSDAATTQWTYDDDGRIKTRTDAFGATGASTVSYNYDAGGRLLTQTDGDGNQTTYTYDNDGRVLTRTDGAGGVTTNQYNVLGELVAVTDPRGNTGYFYYDNLGRQILQVDAQGYATATSYDQNGQVLSVRRYFTPVSVSGVSATPPALTTSASDNVTTFTRDADGRVLTSVDGNVYTTTYAYDAFGDKISMTNALGGVTTWTYDGRGLMLSQTTPAGATAPASTTAYVYDAFGNRTQMIEAQGRTEQRTTTYTYDNGNRLTQQTADAVTVTTLTGATSTVTPTQTFVYDNRGNLIKATDADGAVTYTYYDLQNRKIAQVDALNHLTTWTYDGNGNVLSQTRYTNAVSGTPPVGGTAPTVTASGSDRTVTYGYDGDNRQTSTSVQNVERGSWTGTSWTSTTGTLTTTTTYDADGNVTRTTDGNGNASYAYYDKLGRRIASVDAGGYLTTYTLDAEGNVVSQTQYATAVSGTPPTGGTPPSVATNANDRTTTFTYDHDGQRLTETRGNASVATVNGGSVATATQSVAVTYTYNALGQVTSKREATGDTTAYSYDTLGRLVQVTTANGAANAMITQTTYDGLGNVLTTVAGYGTTYAETTAYAYGAGGRLATQTDAQGFATTYGYDAKGQVTVQSYTRVKSDGSSVQEATLTAYNALGQVASTGKGSWNGSSWVAGDLTDTYYDAFGEVAASGVNTGGNIAKAQTFFDYDIAGRVWRTNSGDGITKVYGYDGNGNQTVEVVSQGTTDLRNVSSLDAALTASGTTKTYNIYDKRNELVDVKRPISVNLDGTVASGGNAVVDTSGQVAVNCNIDGGTWGGNTTATFNVTINSPEVTANNGTGQIHVLITSDDSAVVPNQSGTFASGTMNCGTYSFAFANGAQPGPGSYNYSPPKVNVTVQVYQDNGSGGTIQLMAPNTVVVVCQPGSSVAIPTSAAVGKSLRVNVPNATGVTAYVRQAGSTGGYTQVTSAQVYDINATPVAGARFVDLTKPPFNSSPNTSWDVVYVATNASGQVLDAKDGTINFDSRGVPAATSFASVANFVPSQNGDGTWTLNANPVSIAYSDASQVFNAFGDVTSQTDANGNTTLYSYDVLGDMTQKTAPQVTSVGENGVGSTVAPTDIYYYDQSGRLVGHKDANGNLTTQTLLAGSGYGGSAALSVYQYNPDGGQTHNSYDIFGNVTTQTDAMGAVTTNTYDRDNRLIQAAHATRGSADSAYTSGPSQRIDAYVYDGLGQRIKHINSILGPETTDYDLQGRVTRTVSFAGETTAYSYTWNAMTASGRVTAGQAGAGSWTKTTTNVAGMSSTATTDTFGTIGASADFGGHSFTYTYNLGGQLIFQTGSAGQSLAYTYTSSGQIGTVVDNATGIEEVFAYDKNGNRTVEGYYRIGSTPGDYQNSVITYDALNRVKEINDANADITYSYDAVGNRREVKSVYTNVNRLGQVTYVSGGSAGSTQTQDYWYKYDSMNRFVLTEGTLSGGVISTGTTGVAITYDARGDRMSATYGRDGHTETYAYSIDGYLETVTIAGYVNVKRVTDVLGREVSDTEYQANSTSVLSTRSMTYDGDNRVTDETDMTYNAGITYTSQIHNDYKAYVSGSATYSGTDQGVITHSAQVQTQSNTSSSTTTSTVYSYVWWNQAKSATVAVSGGSTGNATYSYDQNGNLASVNDSGVNRVITYQTDSFGQVLARKETDSGAAGVYRNFFYLNGQTIGDVGTDRLAGSVDYAQQMATDRSNAANAGNTPVILTATPNVGLNANFDENYQADNASSVGQSSSSYTVMAGDTLQSIAQTVWGDSSLWYLIADANGLDAGDTLAAGESLSIPDQVTNLHNATGITKPYNPSDALSNTNPTLQPEPQPAAPSGSHHGCGVVGDVLATIVAAVVTYLTFGATAGMLPILQGATVMAAGDAAFQATEMAVGNQSKFNWAELGASAVAGGISGGLGLMNRMAGPLSHVSSGLGQAVFDAAGSNLVRQDVNMAFGLQKTFDWTNLAVSAVAGGLGYEAAPWASQFGKLSGAVLNGTAAGLASAATRSALTGEDFGKSVRDSLPDAIGNTIGNMVADGFEQQSASTAQLSASDNALLAGAASVMSGGDPNGYVPGGNSGSSPNALQALLSQDNVTDTAGPGGGGSHYTVGDYWVSADGKTFTIQAVDGGGKTQNIDFNPPNGDYTFGQNGNSVYYIGSTGNIIHDSPFSPQDLQNLVDGYFSPSASATQGDAQAAVTAQNSTQLFNSGIQYSAFSDINTVLSAPPSNTWMDSEGKIYVLGEGPEGSTITIPTVARAYDYFDQQRDYNNQSVRNIVQGANQGFVSSVLVNHEVINGESLEAQERALAAGEPIDGMYAAAALAPAGYGSIEPAMFDRYEAIFAAPRLGDGKVPEGIVYSRIDLNGDVLPYGGQTQNYERYLQRQIEHARNYPDADFEFTIVDRANPGAELDVAEHQYIQQLTGGVRASRSPLVSNLRDPVGPIRRPLFGLPEPRNK